MLPAVGQNVRTVSLAAVGCPVGYAGELYCGFRIIR